MQCVLEALTILRVKKQASSRQTSPGAVTRLESKTFYPGN